MQRQIRMHQIARLGAQTLLPHHFPELAQIHHVGPQRLHRRIFGGRAHDVSGILGRLESGLDRCTQAFALGFILDARRNPHPMALRHVHEVTGRQGDVGRQARALGSQWILHDLDQDFIALGHQRADVLGARRFNAGLRVARVENIRGVEERRALHADFDERRLHAGKHPRDASLVDVADQPAAAGALEKHLLQHAILDHRGARLVSTCVDQNVGAHCVGPADCQCATPASRSSSAVSNSGNPMTPEKLPRRSAMNTAARPWMA